MRWTFLLSFTADAPSASGPDYFRRQAPTYCAGHQSSMLPGFKAACSTSLDHFRLGTARAAPRIPLPPTYKRKHQ